MTITTQPLRGAELAPHLDALAHLRITIFQEYPYLYKGETDYEKKYLSTYANSPDAMAILAWDGDTLAGSVTAIPMQDEMEELALPVRQAGYPLESVFYIGELLFLPPYRGMKLGTKLIDMAEETIRAMGGFSYVTCATIIRPDNHPMRPSDFIPIDRFLARTGYAKMDGVIATLHWPELDGVSIPHEMQYWIKPLASQMG